MLRFFESGRSWFLGMVLLIGSLGRSVKAEESATTVDSANDRIVSSVVDKTLLVISRVKLADKNYFARDKIQFEIDEANSLLELRLQYSESVQQMLSKRLEVAEMSIQKLATLQQEMASEVQLTERETLEELSRSCLMERQRLEWDAVTTELKIEAEKKGHTTSRGVGRARLQSQKLEIEGIQQKLSAARAEYEQMKSLFEKGNISSTEARKAEGSYRELENRLQIALVNLEATEAEANLIGEASLEKPAIEKKSLGERMKLIESQLEKLASQRKILSEVESIDREIAFESNLLQELKRQFQQAESERMSYEVLKKMLASVLEKSKPAGQHSNEADK